MVNSPRRLILVTTRVVLALGTLQVAEAPAAGRESQRPVDRVYDVSLPPPDLRHGGDTRIPACVGVVRQGQRTTRDFVLPKFESVGLLVMGDSTLRYEFRSPGGKRFVPGDSAQGAGIESGGTGGFKFLSIERPEPGRWNVTIEGDGSRDSALFGIDISTSDSVDEQPRLEALQPGSDPARLSTVRPGSLVYVRTFLLRDDGAVPGVEWKVHATTMEGSRQEIPVFDDGLHADGASADGIHVGSVRFQGPDGVLLLAAEALTREGVRYAETSFLEVQAKYDLLVSGEILVSPDPGVGKPLTLTVTVKNDGARDYGEVELGLFLKLGTASWEEEVSRRVFELKAGESRRIQTRWTPTAPGTYEVRLTVDPFLEPYECDYSNNSRKTTVIVR